MVNVHESERFIKAERVRHWGAAKVAGKIILLTFTFFFLSCNGKVEKGDGSVFFQPDTSFPSLDGKSEFNFLKESDSSVEVLYVNFFAPGCKPCIDEIPELLEFHRVAKDLYPQVRFIGIGSLLEASADFLSSEDVRPQINEFVKDFSIDYPVYLAGVEELARFNVTGFPETFIFFRDKSGKWYLRRKYISSITVSELEKYARGK